MAASLNQSGPHFEVAGGRGDASALSAYPPAYMNNSNHDELLKAQEKFRNVVRHCGRDIFRERDFSNVMLITTNGDVPAHKVVLATRSPKMRGLFLYRDLLREQQQHKDGVDRIEIDGHTKEEVETLLELLYTGESSRLAEHIKGVFLLSRKYEIEDVLALAEAGLFSTMNRENALDLFLLAAGETNVNLSEAVAQFIIKPANRNVVMTSDKLEFLKVNHKEVYIDLLEYVVAAL